MSAVRAVLPRLRPGHHVRVTRGVTRADFVGRIGVVQTVSVGGAAVRLSASIGGFPFTEVRVIPIADLERVPRLRTDAALAAVMDAPF